MKKTIILGALLSSLAASAYSLPLEAIGKPHSALHTMQAEGRHIEIKEGLRQLIPSEFRTLVHKDVLLPAHINWQTGQDWLSILESMARQEHLTIKVDWTRNIVYIEKDKDPKVVVEKLQGPTIDDLIRKEPKAAEKKAESGTSGGPTQSADKVGSPRAAVVATESLKRDLKEKSSEAPSDTKATSPMVTPKVEVPKVQVTAQAMAANEQLAPSVKQAGSENRTIEAYKVPVVLSLSNLMKEVAKTHSAEVVNYAPDAQLSSALIPPGLDLGEDLSLIHRAIGGADAPVSIRVYRRSDVFEVIPAQPGQARFEVEMKVPYAGPLTKRQMPVYPRH